MSKGSSQSSSNTIDPALMALYTGNYNAAQGVANRPYQPYTGQVVSDQSPQQIASQSLVGNIAQQQPGAAALGAGVTATQGLTGFAPQQVTAGTLPQTNIQAYMNPYMQNVVNPTQQLLAQQNALALQATNQGADNAGAFGGSRQGVADALTNSQYALTAGQTLGGLEQQGYAQAQGAAQQDIANQLTAARSNQTSGILGAQTQLGAANQLGALSNQQLNQPLTIANALYGSGSQQQQQQQNILSNQYQQFLNQWNYPYTQQQIRNQSLVGLPTQQTTTGTQTPGLLDYLGQGIGAAGLANSLGAFGGGAGAGLLAGGGTVGYAGSLLGGAAGLGSIGGGATGFVGTDALTSILGALAL